MLVGESARLVDDRTLQTLDAGVLLHALKLPTERMKIPRLRTAWCDPKETRPPAWFRREDTPIVRRNAAASSHTQPFSNASEDLLPAPTKSSRMCEFDCIEGFCQRIPRQCPITRQIVVAQPPTKSFVDCRLQPCTVCIRKRKCQHLDTTSMSIGNLVTYPF